MEDAKILDNKDTTEVVAYNQEVVDVSDNQEIIEAPIDKEEAKKLTEDIKSTTTALYVLIKKAHDTKAWMSLGYKSWTEYIENEFDFSRARSYQLINQANVIEEINNASGVPLYITEREARDIKKRLPEITEQLEKDVKDADLSEEEAEERAREIIEESKDNKNDIDNADNYQEEGNGGSSGSGDGWDNPEDYEPKEDSSPAFSDNGGYSLTDEDRFYYENLLVTLKIFESMPNAVLLGEKLSKSGENTKELVKLAEESHDWITKLLNEVK